MGFNPRTREGANLSGTYNIEALTVSIHAPVKVRTTLFILTTKQVVFQSTHP